MGRRPAAVHGLSQHGGSPKPASRAGGTIRKSSSGLKRVVRGPMKGGARDYAQFNDCIEMGVSMAQMVCAKSIRRGRGAHPGYSTGKGSGSRWARVPRFKLKCSECAHKDCIWWKYKDGSPKPMVQRIWPREKIWYKPSSIKKGIRSPPNAALPPISHAQDLLAGTPPSESQQ
ncbi:hypothetical protein BS50DRAFT_157991 [Corynespora cassiicola Philippines]|uniref:Uncharacterized protein n=1 Tax=Corynespora cassiicola Philippines TaxID=1448308 RepID=A0A2T2N767_CORCC|nr:hypothetical protein BS50DRAFT_157991 [Corynespora cassiicola Philippines]